MSRLKRFFEDIKAIEDMPLSTVIIVIFVLIFFYFLFIFSLHFNTPVEKIVLYADIFNKVTIGLGAMLAGIGGLAFLGNYFAFERANIRKRHYMNLFPLNEFPNRFDIVNRKGNIKDLFLRDKKNKAIRHIANGITYETLGWSQFEVTTLTDKDFFTYTKGNKVIVSDN